jgi:hypothetical protein
MDQAITKVFKRNNHGFRAARGRAASASGRSGGGRNGDIGTADTLEMPRLASPALDDCPTVPRLRVLPHKRMAAAELSGESLAPVRPCPREVSSSRGRGVAVVSAGVLASVLLYAGWLWLL